MVSMWSNLVHGEPHFKLGQVALNDSIMVVAFAPIVGLLLGLSSITVPWEALLFGLPGEQITRQPAVIAMLAVPIMIQV